MTTREILTIQLQETLKLLQLIRHRNKNQHRHAKWWKWLAMLKRSVNKLIQELQAFDRATSHLRVSYLKDTLIPKCYVPFTQLVQDNQFAPLGLALVGELAKTKKTLDALDAERTAADGLPTISAFAYHSTESLGFESFLEDVGQSVKREPLNSRNLQNHLLVSREASAAKDLQLDSSPEADRKTAGKHTQPWVTTLTASSDPSQSSGIAKSKARKIHSNIIDQLFQGLA